MLRMAEAIGVAWGIAAAGAGAAFALGAIGQNAYGFATGMRNVALVSAALGLGYTVPAAAVGVALPPESERYRGLQACGAGLLVGAAFAIAGAASLKLTYDVFLAPVFGGGGVAFGLDLIVGIAAGGPLVAVGWLTALWWAKTGAEQLAGSSALTIWPGVVTGLLGVVFAVGSAARLTASLVGGGLPAVWPLAGGGFLAVAGAAMTWFAWGAHRAEASIAAQRIALSASAAALIAAAAITLNVVLIRMAASTWRPPTLENWAPEPSELADAVGFVLSTVPVVVAACAAIALAAIRSRPRPTS